MQFFKNNTILLCYFFKIPLFFVSFAAMNCPAVRRAFIVETFTSTNESVTATQRAFGFHFSLG